MSDDTLTLREIQLAELDILKQFDSFCRAHDICYSITAGTLLGAVRHKGFIPWDDDIDVFMPRPDYEKLLGLAGAVEAETGYVLSGHHDIELSVSPFAKLVDPCIFVMAEDLFTPEHLWVDVFPVDGLENDPHKLKVQCYKADLMRLMLAAKTSPVKSAHGMARRLVKRLFWIVGLPMSARDVAEHMTLHGKRVSFESADIVGPMIFSSCVLRDSFPRKAFDDMTTLEFEGESFPSIGCWDAYLTSVYGDYMQLPPVEKRATHGLTAWRSRE